LYMLSLCITYNTMENTTKSSTEIGISKTTKVSLAYARNIENIHNLLTSSSISIHVTTTRTTATEH